MWLDTDEYNHTNFSSYIRFAVNGLRRAIQLMEWTDEIGPKNKDEIVLTKQAHLCLPHISTKILKNGTKKVDVNFSKDCRQGDILDVHLWQEFGQALTVFCLIELKGQALCHIHLQYFSALSHL